MGLDYFEKFEASIPSQTNPKLKLFDLEIGDKVKQVVRREHGLHQVEINIYIYVVKNIFKHVILCENKWGEKTTFTKVDYQTGIITKAEEDRDAYF